MDEILEIKDSLELKEGVLASIKPLSNKEYKEKLTEEARLVTLTGKESKDILKEVVMKSLISFSIEEILRKTT